MSRQSVAIIFIGFLFQTYDLGAAAQAQNVSSSAQVSAQPVVAQVQRVVVSQQENSEQVKTVELTQEQQRFLPALLRKRVWKIDGAAFRGLSVNDENDVAVLKDGKLNVWDLQGKTVKLPGMGSRKVASYSFASGRDLFVRLGDGGVYSLSIQDGGFSCVDGSANSSMTPYAITRETFALIDERTGAVSIKWPDTSSNFMFGYSINLIAHDGQKSFMLGNRCNTVFNVVKRGAPCDKITIDQALPTAFALTPAGTIYVGTRDGKIYRADAQRNWICFETGMAQPVAFLAAFSDILMVLHENDTKMQIFSSSNHGLLYTIHLSKNPIKQIAVNRRGTIAYIDNTGAMGIISLDDAALQCIAALSQQQKNLLQGLLRYSQQHELSSAVLAQKREELATLPQPLITNIQKLSPVRLQDNADLPQGMSLGQGIDFGGLHSNQGASPSEKMRLLFQRCARRINQFVGDNPKLTSVMVASIFYIAFFQQQAIRKKSQGFVAWFRNLFARNKPRFFFF